MIGAEDLASRRFVSIVENLPSRQRVDSIFAAAGVRRTMPVLVQTGAIAAAMVKARVGVAVLGPFTCHFALDDTLVIRPFRPPLRYVYSAILPAHRPVPRMTRKFLAATRASVPDVLPAPGSVPDPQLRRRSG